MSTYLWQNFLKNKDIINFITDNIKENIDKNLNSIEIWPWKWALTKNLWFVKKLKLFEKDKNFYDILKKYVNTEDIIMWDFLVIDLDKYIKTDFFNVFWNIPYYITSPIFRKLTNPYEKKIMKYWIFMIQKEVWEKIKTDSNKKTMLYFLLNYKYKLTYLKTVPSKDFEPEPKVDSCLIKFEYIGGNEQINFEELKKLLVIITTYKRKTLLKIQKILKKQGKNFYITKKNEQKRLHELSWEDLKIIIENSNLN